MGSLNNILKAGSKNLNTENWKVFHPSGRHMFTCGEKKANWYLDKNLATIMGNKQIQFNFEPKGNGFEDNEEFGRGMRESRCVVSGIETNLQRHHIVPYCYRQFFPEKFKSKNHHDVVLINSKKHSEYEQIANEYKDEIARIYEVNTISELNIEYTSKLRENGKDESILLNNIHSLFRNYNKMPEEVKLSKLVYISENSNLSFETLTNLNYIQLYKLYLLLTEEHISNVQQFKDDNRYLYEHGYYVMQKLDTEEKIIDFVKLWRNHFINTMHPEYMPYGWSIDFRIKTNV